MTRGHALLRWLGILLLRNYATKLFEVYVVGGGGVLVLLRLQSGRERENAEYEEISLSQLYPLRQTCDKRLCVRCVAPTLMEANGME